MQTQTEDFPQRRPDNKRLLGDILLDLELVTEEQLQRALDEQETSRLRVGEILVANGHLTQLELIRALSVRLAVPFANLGEMQVDPSVSGLISERDARRYAAIPVSYVNDHTLLVAMVDPANIFAVDDLRMLTGYDIEPAIATEEDIFEQIGKVSRLGEKVAENLEDQIEDGELSDDQVRDIRETIDEAPIVKLVNSILAQAADDGASDVHFEPQSKEMVVRFRNDGVLHEIMSIPRRMQQGVLSRLKIMADLDIAERRVPQDGRIGLMVGGKPIDMRVASLPTVYGEKIVLRLLDRSNVMLKLEDLGFSPKSLARYQKSFMKPYGTILVTGPTGSGKSTTLYATLNILNEVHRNIITIEDPVEYRLSGINQIQVHPRAGLTFAKALRSILRADPDIILLGEIRDRETAIIGIEAALTGHLVLSTLHTNSAASTPLRLVEMGVEPFLVTSALDCVLAQRLARRLCDRCKEAYQPTESELVEAGWPIDDLGDGDWPTLHRRVGCSSCGRTGYRGRFAIHEVMLMTEEIKRMVIERRSTEDLQKTAVMHGMLTLREDGLRKVAAGQTSLEEVFRVVA